MVKLAYLSAAFLAATMNLFPVVYASLANSTVAMDTKPEPTGIVQILAEADAVINLFTAPDHGKTFLKQLTLVLDECAPLPGAYGVVHWKKDPTAFIVAFKRLPSGACDCSNGPFALLLFDECTHYDIQPYNCIMVFK